VKRVALLSALLLLLVSVGWAVGRAAATRDPYGGAFTGPCFFEPHSAKGPAARLTLTDHGPAVTVGHIDVANFDASGRPVDSTRLRLGSGSDIVVARGQTRTFLVAAPRGTYSCKLADWGE
jgi:hypothetical protein